MNKAHKLICLVSVLVACVRLTTGQECICDVRIQGEYCGTELNRRLVSNQCETNQIYFCGDKNDQKEAKPLATCKDEDECQQNQFTLTARTRRRNPCLRRMNCTCPAGAGRGPYCGSELVGSDCPPDMVFKCRRSGWDSREVCPQGCTEGRCAGDVDRRSRRRDRNERRRDRNERIDRRRDRDRDSRRDRENRNGLETEDD